MTTHNPWAGLASYQDPATAERPLLFCGRQAETLELSQLIDDNIFVTLYGKSGIGKTSLLNAGVFPRLRELGYVPVSIRLGMEAVGRSFQRCIVERLRQVCQVEELPVLPPCADESDTLWLWNWFARMRFRHEGREVFPVVVFDQMEEVFRDRRDEAETLLRQVHYMADGSHTLPPRTLPDGSAYDYDFNFRFVATVREDDLYRLEDSLDRCYLPAMKRPRYRLHALSDASATEVVLVPGREVLDPSHATEIADAVIDMARSEQDDSINTNLLSLLCARLYAGCRRRGEERITLPMLGELMKDNPIIQFYNEATAGLRSRELYYIENSLVDAAGRRSSVREADFRLHVRNADRLLEGSNKILQRTSTGDSADDWRIELVHDSFCEPLIESKERRGGRKMLWWLAGGFVLLYLLVIALIKPMNVLRQADGVESNYYSLLHAAYSQQALAGGDTDLAVRLALEALGRNDWGYWDYRRVYTPSADAALRAAMSRHPAFAHLFEVGDSCRPEYFVALDDGQFCVERASYNVEFDTCFLRVVVDSVLAVYTMDSWDLTSRCDRLVATYPLQGLQPVEIAAGKDEQGYTFCLRDAAGACRCFRYPGIRTLIDSAAAYYQGTQWTPDEVSTYKIGADERSISYEYMDHLNQ